VAGASVVVASGAEAEGVAKAAFLKEEAVPLLGFAVDKNGISVQVPSGGCSVKNDLSVDIRESEPAQLVIKRKEADDCEGNFPFGKKFRFSWKDLGLKLGQKFLLVNPLSELAVPLKNF
jgi:hypothetical protein